MNPTKILVIGEYNESFPVHPATDAALAHAAAAIGARLEGRWVSTGELQGDDVSALLGDASGLWIAPGSPYLSLAGALEAIRFAREAGMPLLGTCGGFQHMILEYARHVLGFHDAEHAEYDPYASRLIVSRLACSLSGRTLSITLRPDSLVARSYGRPEVSEGYYCNFGVNPEYASLFRSGELAVVGSDDEGEVRIVEHASHPFFVGTLFVPQMRSSPEHPHPLVVAFLREASRARHE